jgi:Fe-coproporphyrin III synthase
MCNVWKNPSLPNEEISLDMLKNLPGGMGSINLTGGEPTLRSDLMEIVEILYPKTRNLEISSNGLLPQKLEPIIRKYPDIKIRLSLEGFEETNNLIRGENNGYQIKMDGLLRLQELGGTDLGIATTIQDDNADELVGLFRFTEKHGFELATSTLHNGFQFHKNDNVPYNRILIAQQIEKLITEQLRTNKIKNWFRAYLDLGLIAKVLGNKRLLPCETGRVSAFIDPWGRVYACNVRPDLYMGDLNKQTLDEVMTSPLADEVRKKVDQCEQNCWMVGSAKTAMRQSRFTKLPRWKPFIWVLTNKIKVTLGQEIDFKKSVNFSFPAEEGPVPHRMFYLNQSVKRTLQRKEDEHYIHLGEYQNK